MSGGDDRRAAIAEALAALGVERLVLAIHDASFPGAADEDLGRGSPHSGGGRAFFRFAAGLGFTGVQLGPQGKTSAVNLSPYDGTLFAKSPLSIALGPLVRDDRFGGLLSEPALAALVRTRPPGAERRVRYGYARNAQARALRAAFAALPASAARQPALAEALVAFRRDAAEWLAPDCLYEALSAAHGTDDWRQWPGLDARLLAPRPGEESACAARQAKIATDAAPALAYNAFCQFLVHAQHASLRDELARLGLALYGDLQIGISHRDLWRFHPLALEGYRLGAPPSRTNEVGQPWGYPVLDPRLYQTTSAAGAREDGPALAFLRARAGKLLAEFDGIRIDHPHGLICPWVYSADDPDPLGAVQRGARLFASPNLPDHPALAPFSIALEGQLSRDRGHPRYAEDWVRALEDEQVERYAILIDAIVEEARARGRSGIDVVCEVLSTCPLPVAAVLARHGLGRFRVTQKANPNQVRDPYRTERAAAADWVMPGTHDTAPLWAVAPGWIGTPRADAWASYLAARLAPTVEARAGFAARIASDARALCQALFADLFVGPARRVSIFFADLLGMTEIYNRPGVVSAENWTLRVPPDCESLYRARCAKGEALDLPAALATALRARGGAEAVIARVERFADGRA